MPRNHRLSKRNKISLIAALIIGLLTLLFQYLGLDDNVSDKLQQNQPGLYKVTRFVDGDTISIDMNGKVEKVRFIGVDTPETHKPNAPVQCYGPAASAFTKNLISDNRVRLEADPLSTNRDRYDRLLRYVYLPNNTLVNQKIIEQGYGFYYPYFPFTKSTIFDAAQASAKSKGKGLWGNCSPKPTEKGGWISNDL